MGRTSIKGGTGDDEERQGEDCAEDCATAVSPFSLFFLDGKIPKGVYILDEHLI